MATERKENNKINMIFLSFFNTQMENASFGICFWYMRQVTSIDNNDTQNKYPQFSGLCVCCVPLLRPSYIIAVGTLSREKEPIRLRFGKKKKK